MPMAFGLKKYIALVLLLLSLNVYAGCEGRLEERVSPRFPITTMNLAREIRVNGACSINVEYSIDETGTPQIIDSHPSRDACTYFSEEAEKSVRQSVFSKGSNEECETLITFEIE